MIELICPNCDLRLIGRNLEITDCPLCQTMLARTEPPLQLERMSADQLLRVGLAAKEIADLLVQLRRQIPVPQQCPPGNTRDVVTGFRAALDLALAALILEADARRSHAFLTRVDVPVEGMGVSDRVALLADATRRLAEERAAGGNVTPASEKEEGPGE